MSRFSSTHLTTASPIQSVSRGALRKHEAADWTDMSILWFFPLETIPTESELSKTKNFFEVYST